MRVHIAQYDEFHLRYQDIARPVVSQLLEVDLGEAHAGTWRRSRISIVWLEVTSLNTYSNVIVYRYSLWYLTGIDV